MLKVVIVMIIAITFIGNATAGMNEFESCRCKKGLATKGDLKVDVVQKCGEPAHKSYREDRDCREMWIYNFGPNEFMQGICFDRKEVKKVVSLSRGF